jgi:membrane protein insertase Oxa1/YidC/SpoIIIJ
MSQSMMLTMPLMFAFITINLASGLAVYFIISNLVGMAIQYFINRAMPMPAGGAAGKLAKVKTTPTPASGSSQSASQRKKRTRSSSKRKGKGKRR